MTTTTWCRSRSGVALSAAGSMHYKVKFTITLNRMFSTMIRMDIAIA